MARIRAIKPEFWSSPGIETMRMESRLLYIAMWNWADDFGVGVANPRELLGFVFPLDEEIAVTDLRRMLVEIRRVFGVTFYSVAGRRYYSIPAWEKHQKFDRRSKGKHPGPDHPEAIIEGEEKPAQDMNQESPPNPRVNPTSTRRDSVAGTGEEGTGEEGTVFKDLSDSDESDDPALPQESSSKPKKKTRHEYSPEFEEFWKTWPNARGASKFETSKKFTAALKAADAETILAGTRRFANDPNLEVEFCPMPTTWLNNRRWEAGPLPARPQSSPQQPQATSHRFGTRPEDWGAQAPAEPQRVDYSNSGTIIDDEVPF